MKYLSLDFETTGLEAGVHSPLSFAAIWDDGRPLSDLPMFEYKFAWERIVLDLPAARINNELLCSYLNGVEGFELPEDFKERFMSWLVGDCGFNPIKDRLNLAGKNPAFDHAFLKQLGITCCRHRHIDPALWYTEWNKDDAVPGLAKCLERAGIKGLTLHTAKDDAMAIVLLIRSYLAL